MKAQPPVDSRSLLIPVYLPALFLTFAQGVMVPTLPLYAQSFGMSFALVSIVVAAAGVGTLIADVPVGMLLGRMGRKPLMVAGSAAQAVACLALCFAVSFPEMVAFRLIAGLAGAMWNISRMAYLTEVVPIADRGRALSTFGGLMRIGMFVGPAAGGLLGAQLGLQAPFFLAAGLGVAASLIALLLVPESRSIVSTRRKMRWRVLGTLAKTHRSDLATAGAAQVFGQMIRAGRQIIIPLYAASALGLDVGSIGAIVSISALVDMSLFVPAGIIMDRFGRKFASVPSFLVMGIGMALVPFATDYLSLLLATCVMALGNGIGSGTMMTLGADLAPREATGEFLGLWRLIGDLGQTGGPLVVGTVADLLGLGIAAFALAGVGVAAAALLAAFVRETLDSEPAAEKGQARGTA